VAQVLAGQILIPVTRQTVLTGKQLGNCILVSFMTDINVFYCVACKAVINSELAVNHCHERVRTHGLVSSLFAVVSLMLRDAR